MDTREKKLNIVFCYRSFYPHIGGMENCILQLAQRLNQRCNIYVITPQLDGESPKIEIISGIKIFRYRISTLRWIPAILNNFIRTFQIIRLAGMIYRENGPFVFNFFDPYPEQVYAGLFLRMKMATNIICSLGGTAAEYSSSYIKRLASHCADVIAGHSGYILKAFGIVRQDAHVFYLVGSEPTDFSTRMASRDSKTSLTVCRVHPRKNLEFLIEVASAISDIQFLVAGNYNLQKSYYESLTRKMEERRVKNVRFLGEVHESMLARLYSQSSIFFLPTKHEVFGMVFAEALSYGLPVIAPDHTSVPEAVGPGGILYAPGNSDECIKAIRLLTASPERWMKVSTNAKTFMRERFTHDFIGKYSQLILTTAMRSKTRA